MNKPTAIYGEVVGTNSIQYEGRIVNCWVSEVDDPKKPQPLDLSQHEKEVVELEGFLHNGLWEAKFRRKFYRGNEASSLNDLLKIRAANRMVIEEFNSDLGTALGYKWSMNRNTKHPCIIVFVPEKMSPEDVSEEKKVPTIMEEPNGKWCFTDVLSGKVKKSSELPPLDEKNKEIIKELESKEIGLVGGIKLLFKEEGKENYATAGIVVTKNNGEGEMGFLVNRHITGSEKRDFYHPTYDYKIASYEKSEDEPKENISYEKWYGIRDEPNGVIKPDFAYAKISGEILTNGGPKVLPGLHKIGGVGPLKIIDLDTMDIIGQKVISIGCRRGIQRGTVIAFSHEYIDSEDYENYYVDLLIKGEKSTGFSDFGDSGKIIVTDDEEYRPLGLHIGGWQGYFQKNAEIEMFGYALDLKKVLDNLNLEIYTEKEV